MAREWTEEQKQAARERLAAARERKREIIEKRQQANQERAAEPAEEVAVPEKNVQSVDPSVAELTKMVLELKQKLDDKERQNPQLDLLTALQAMNGTQQGQMGKPTGVQDKYSTTLSLYPDPREELANETRLKRIAFEQNYELDWDVTVTRYQTADNLWYREPKFNLKLNQIVLDDDGEKTNKRIGKAQLIFFEDPDTAVIVAQQNGLPVDDDNSAEFLNAMRYLRARDWLFECFWPPKQTSMNNKSQMVIGGSVVETWEVSTGAGDSVKIPFDQLKRG